MAQGWRIPPLRDGGPSCSQAEQLVQRRPVAVCVGETGPARDKAGVWAVSPAADRRHLSRAEQEANAQLKECQ